MDRRPVGDRAWASEGCRTDVEQMRHTIVLAEDDIQPEMMTRLMTAFRDWRRYAPEPGR